MMQYNKNKHLKLLKSLEKPEYSRKNLWDQEFLTDEEFRKRCESRPDENFFELRSYSIMLICHLHWENREHYFELIEKLLNGPINFGPLRKKHRIINNAGEMLEAGLILLEPNPKSEGFDELIDDLVSLFYIFCPDPSIRESHELSEEELKKVIQKIFIEMKNRYP
jgi:hypothetical protein